MVIQLIYITIIIFIICSILGCSGSGVITGCVCDPNRGGIQNAMVGLIGAHELLSGAITGMQGQFLIENVPTGNYRLRASVIGYHQLTFFNVRVGADSISIVYFKMAGEMIPEEPDPIPWSETDPTILPKEQFIQSGKLFNSKCK